MDYGSQFTLIPPHPAIFGKVAKVKVILIILLVVAVAYRMSTTFFSYWTIRNIFHQNMLWKDRIVLILKTDLVRDSCYNEFVNQAMIGT